MSDKIAPPPYSYPSNNNQPFYPQPTVPQTYPQQNYNYQQQPSIVVTTSPNVIMVGGCPNCRIGIMTESYGCCAIFLAVFFFPLGVLCCLAMREKRCTNCGYSI